jgi:16S rRNA (uracil1498-N3)-methyltransferase
MRTSTPACFLAPGVDHAVGQVFELSGPEGHHAAAVRRVRVGEQVYVADGAGEAVLAEVVSVGKNQVGLRVLEA